MSRKADVETAVAELLPVVGQFQRRLRAVSNTRELSWTQVAIMGRLEQVGAMTIADLARAEAVKPQSMGMTLAAMEEEGLVERRPDPNDGRQILFGLTEEGLDTRKQVKLAKHEWLVAAVAKLSQSEQETLVAAVDLLRRLESL
ncbi:MarR family winged helix-turn-helix transcriptional regulator [Rhizobium sp. NPDC090279]|uniref:MarR family winged helix-turn-helix transcriptional regulator n=1 Tax=Rhizobium sp. NPDC090279 TaxID=3364499 RepID=UPI00383AAE75